MTELVTILQVRRNRWKVPMRKIIVSMWITLDGFVAGPDDEMDWLLVDDQMYRYESDLVETSGTLLLGRVTYGDFAGAWPAVAKNSSADEPARTYARRVDAMEKVCVSGSLKTLDWDNSNLMANLDLPEIENLKRRPGSDVVVYGSLSVVDVLAGLDTIDEYQLLVHPIFLGDGTKLFKEPRTVNLELTSSDTFESGVVLLKYRPSKAC